MSGIRLKLGESCCEGSIFEPEVTDGIQPPDRLSTPGACGERAGNPIYEANARFREPIDMRIGRKNVSTQEMRIHSLGQATALLSDQQASTNGGQPQIGSAVGMDNAEPDLLQGKISREANICLDQTGAGRIVGGRVLERWGEIGCCRHPQNQTSRRCKIASGDLRKYLYSPPAGPSDRTHIVIKSARPRAVYSLFCEKARPPGTEPEEILKLVVFQPVFAANANCVMLGKP
jgi:hypothetical protein